MAHPFKKQADASAAAKKSRYAEGGKVPFYDKNAGPKGSLERMGVNIYRRELGRTERGSFGGKQGISDFLEGKAERAPNMQRGGGLPTAGMEGGEGRLQLSKLQARKRGGK